MKLPEKPPNSGIDRLQKMPKEQIVRFFTLGARLKTFLEKANSEYYYWDKFKQLVPTGELNAEDAWFALKLYRNSLSRPLPFQDKKNRHFHYFITPTMQSLLSKIDQYAAGTLTLDDQQDLRTAGN